VNGLVSLMEREMLPDAVVRTGIRRLLLKRLREAGSGDTETDRLRQREFIEQLRQSPVAVATEAANRQHYELPPEFFTRVLGPRRKYSCCLYPPGVTDLAAAEEAMLGLTCRRAGPADGMDILELGCGWGSLTLWMAGQYPRARITAVSNSAPQRRFIEEECRDRGYANVRGITADMDHFTIDETFDRVVSVEMFEHMRNYAELLRRISCWLRDDGRLIFTHGNGLTTFGPVSRITKEGLPEFFVKDIPGMLVIPIEKSLLYVQPLFLAAADKAGLPELRRVIVAFGDEVVMEETLELALQRIFGGRKAPAVAAATPEAHQASSADLAREAMAIFERATNLQRQGDWAGYGEELRKLQQVLKQLAR